MFRFEEQHLRLHSLTCLRNALSTAGLQRRFITEQFEPGEPQSENACGFSFSGIVRHGAFGFGGVMT